MAGFSRTAAVGAAALLVSFSGCKTVEAPPPRSPPEVVVSMPEVRDVVDYADFTGTTRAIESVEIRARVEGFLERMEFQPSSKVKKNQLMFVIEPQIYQARLDLARADVASSQAALRRAESDLERLEQAVRTNAVSQQEVTRARAERDQADAAVHASNAALTTAEINLEYTTVKSPINGLASRNFVDPGNLVGRGDPTLLARVYNIDPIHVYFDVNERLLAQMLERVGGIPQEPGEYEDARQGKLLVALDGSDRVFEGEFDYIDPQIDPNTGTAEVRAEVPNPDGRLLPGFFVRIRVPSEVITDAVVVRETALGADLGGRYIMVVGDGNIVDKRYVVLGPLDTDNNRVIREGISAGERYVSSGLQRARPGMPVTPTSPGGAS